MPASPVEVEFVVHEIGHEDRWTPIARFTPEAAAEMWAAQPHITCCTLQAGFLIGVDGEPWNLNAIDEISMARTWLSATTQIFAGYPRVSVWAWEESSMQLTCRDEVLDAFDVHHSGHIVCPRIRLPLRPFARALAEAGSAAGVWFEAVLAHARSQGADELVRVLEGQLAGDWRELGQTLLEAAEGPIAPSPPNASGPLPEVLICAKLRDLDGLERALATSPPPELGPHDKTYEGTSPLHAAIQSRWVEGGARLLAAGAPLDVVDSLGFTPLQQAARLTEPARGPLVAHLRAAGAVVDPISACLLDAPEELKARAEEGIVDAEALNWWVAYSAHQPELLRDEWVEAWTAAVAAGTSLKGPTGRGIGGWSDTPYNQAVEADNREAAVILRRLGAPHSPTET